MTKTWKHNHIHTWESKSRINPSSDRRRKPDHLKENLTNVGGYMQASHRETLLYVKNKQSKKQTNKHKKKNHWLSYFKIATTVNLLSKITSFCILVPMGKGDTKWRKSDYIWSWSTPTDDVADNNLKTEIITQKCY